MGEKICKNCKEKILGRGVKFCSQKCNAFYQNKKRGKKIKELKKCLNCNNLTKSKKYCSQKCQIKYQRKIIFENIENNKGDYGTKSYKNYLIDKYGNKCMDCGWCEINKYTNKVPIELEHIDGNHKNNNINNIKLLCPNCHSLTPTYKALNKGNGRTKRMEKYNK